MKHTPVELFLKATSQVCQEAGEPALSESELKQMADDPNFQRLSEVFAGLVLEEAGAAPSGQPMQPVLMAGNVARFKPNAIVNHLYEWALPRGMGLNEIALLDFTPEDRMQFAQLIGYSVSGYGDLSYVSDESYDAADAQVRALLKAPTVQHLPADDTEGGQHD